MQEKKSTLEKLSTCFPLFSSLYFKWNFTSQAKVQRILLLWLIYQKINQKPMQRAAQKL